LRQRVERISRIRFLANGALLEAYERALRRRLCRSRSRRGCGAVLRKMLSLPYKRN